MLGKFGILVLVLGAVMLIGRLTSRHARGVERTLSGAARRAGKRPPQTLERDPETGRYRARDDREGSSARR